MRRIVLLAMIVVAGAAAAGCDRSPAKSPAEKPTTNPPTGSGTGATGPTTDLEQAAFDRDRRPDLIVAALGLGPGKRVADIGAGSGLLTVHLARAVLPDGKVVATDIDKTILNLLSSRIHAAGVDKVVEPRVVTEDDPGLEAGQYDAILLSEVDHYFEDPVAWLKAASLALKPGGRLVITNRIHHKPQSLAAAQKAGLVLVSVTTPIPSHFIAIYNRPGA